MAGKQYFNAMDRSQEWYVNILANQHEEALLAVGSILDGTEEDENGCRVTPTKVPRKVQLLGGGDRAYRFVFCITNGVALTRDQVVRHRCHNRRCVNPDHLEDGSRADNIQDERDRRANGVDYGLL